MATPRLLVLDNGLRVVVDEMAVASSALGFFVGSGSRDESLERAGTSHFLEHLLFKGTNELSATQLAEAFDEVGGDCNAFTTKEYTAFYARLLAEHAPMALDILASIIEAPALRPEDIDTERAVIAEELAMHGDEPSDRSAELFSELVFPDSALGRDTLGTKASIAAMSASTIRSFFDAHYGPKNIVVGIAGGQDSQVLLSRLAQLPNRPDALAPQRKTPALPSERFSAHRTKTEQVHLTLGWRLPGRDDPMRTAFAVCNHLLGGGLSSRLFQRIREREALAYSVWSEREVYEDVGALAIMAGTSPQHARDVVAICLEEVERLAEDGPTEREIAIAKGNLRAELLLSAEDSGARMSFVASEVLFFNRIRTTEEIVDELQSVTMEQVVDAASLLRRDSACLAAVGPVRGGAMSDLLLGAEEVSPPSRRRR
ncbi:MAG: pitrilysin family protein [Actinomycetes bacterium]